MAEYAGTRSMPSHENGSSLICEFKGSRAERDAYGCDGFQLNDAFIDMSSRDEQKCL